MFLARSLRNAGAIGWLPIHTLTLSAALLWLTGYLFPQEVEIPIRPASLATNGGHAFTVRLKLPTLPPYLVFRTDQVGAETASVLELTEDGRALGPPHALHSEIRQEGEGRFSHWNGDLYFSTSDNSNPEVNGRVYTAKIPTAPPVWLGLTAVSMILLSLSFSPVVRGLTFPPGDSLDDRRVDRRNLFCRCVHLADRRECFVIRSWSLPRQ